MPYDYNRHRRKRIESEYQLSVQQMLQTVLIEDVPTYGGQTGGSAAPPTPPSGGPTSPIVGQGQVGQAQIP